MSRASVSVSMSDKRTNVMKKNLYNANSIYRHPSGLGNFIHATPALQFISRITNRPVKVQIQNEYIKNCYLDAEFLDFENAYSSDPSDYLQFHEWHPKSLEDDYIYLFREMTGKEFQFQFPTYIDRPNISRIQEKPYLVLLNGGAKSGIGYEFPKKMTRKMLESTLFLADEFNYDVIFLGNDYDLETTQNEMTYFTDYCQVILNDIRFSLSIIDHSALVIANDTGLYHAASAMEKDVIVSTRVPTRPNGIPSRCINTMNPHTTYADEDQWEKIIHDKILSFEQNDVRM